MAGTPPRSTDGDAWGIFAPGTRSGASDTPYALIVLYRSWVLAGDTEPVTALADALAARGFRTSAVYVASLKDAAAAGPLRAHLAADRPDVILNLTGFSARSDAGGSVLDEADAPVLQCALSGGTQAQWGARRRRSVGWGRPTWR